MPRELRRHCEVAENCRAGSSLFDLRRARRLAFALQLGERIWVMYIARATVLRKNQQLLSRL